MQNSRVRRSPLNNVWKNYKWVYKTLPVFRMFDPHQCSNRHSREHKNLPDPNWDKNNEKVPLNNAIKTKSK